MWPAEHLPLIPGISRVFLKFLKVLSFKSFANSCSNSCIFFSGDNNLVPFYLCWRKTIPKCGSVSKYFVQGYIKNLLLVFPAFKMHEIKIKEFHKKVKNLNEYSTDLIWAAFSTKIIVQAKVKNSAFWNKVNSVVCQNSIVSNINFNIKRGFQNIKIYRNCKFQGI